MAEILRWLGCLKMKQLVRVGPGDIFVCCIVLKKVNSYSVGFFFVNPKLRGKFLNGNYVRFPAQEVRLSRTLSVIYGD